MELISIYSPLLLVQVVRHVPEWELWAAIIPTLVVLLLLTFKMTQAVNKREKE